MKKWVRAGMPAPMRAVTSEDRPTERELEDLALQREVQAFRDEVALEAMKLLVSQVREASIIAQRSYELADAMIEARKS